MNGEPGQGIGKRASVHDAASHPRRCGHVGDEPPLQLQNVSKPLHVPAGQGQIAETHRKAFAPMCLEPEWNEQ
jgi:hypothetical protein